jgi:hypothetical protein
MHTAAQCVAARTCQSPMSPRVTLSTVCGTWVNSGGSAAEKMRPFHVM